ncbi:MAG: hypothetical protein RDV48_20130 [Candidatus Eremiobacteraeota bacterium]|nr:hypothetical protein [Candidatus Eremiobacteraeota bacterium]
MVKKTAFLISCVILVLGGILRSEAEAEVNLASSITPHMEIYTAPGDAFSLYYPRGWKVIVNEYSVTLEENPDDPSAAKIDILAVPLRKSLSSMELITMMAREMKKQYPDFRILETRQFNKNPDMCGVMFAYTSGSSVLAGFAVSAAEGSKAVWADLYGKPEIFNTQAAFLLFSYVMQSIRFHSAVPGQPVIIVPDSIARQGARLESAPSPGGGRAPGYSADYRKEFMKKAVTTHMWNMAPYIFPNWARW